MTALIVLLVLAGTALLARWAVHRLDPRVFRPAAPLAGYPFDHERERQLAELRGLRGYREDPPLIP